MHTAKPFVPKHSASEVKVTIGEFKQHKLLGVDQIPVELIQQEGKRFLKFANLLSLSGKKLPLQ
jgi:hypothetical protein